MLMRGLLCLVLLISQPAVAETLSGRVLRVQDGDTITIIDANNIQRTVRLSGVEAPQANQPYGGAAASRLQQSLVGKNVTVEYGAASGGHHSVTGRVFVGDRDVGLEQVQEGLAKYNPTQERFANERYAIAERAAREAERGLWTQQPGALPEEPPNPAVPWARAVSPHAPNCATKSACPQMVSCNEAERYLFQCAMIHLDPDGDGIPCEEGLCR